MKLNEEGMPLEVIWKVPYREVYCVRLRDWVAEVFRCHVWLRVFRPKLPEIG